MPLHLHFNGTLCDDHVHMTAHEYVEHKRKEHHEYQKKMLKKLANNPAISDEFRDVLWNAVWNVDFIDFYRDLYIKERERNNGK